MALTMIFTPRSMDARQYDETIKRLTDAGLAAPAGRLFHMCFGTGNNLRVVDVWESQEAFQAFGQTLLPILEQLGIDPGQPEIAEVHNIVKG
ncbi:MAG: hypothetical protein JOZ18_08900 [Chloroflexi bacterium]|nr:hypothetical protein [Chloroflexota bacterium]